MDCPNNPIERIRLAASYVRLYAHLLRAPGKAKETDRSALGELLHDLADWLDEMTQESTS
ncbi:MAG: hypothetical protein CVV05_05040 [Gammaproteobacteria bacterium HGW-Gammaproteobacteria-1]|jgi:hypothetical protein|nr:MAG: hypothetical protein CVV05_05040 [Gammaproteobacteria bacterium HGW-Gammaproteobacteria-1]